MRMRMAFLLMALSVTACSSRSQNSAEGAAPSNRFEMGEAQFTEARSQGINNVYELVTRFHPEWLRGQPGRGAPSGWLDRNRLGGATALVSVPLASVVRVRYLSPTEAQGELGMDNQGGAIVAYSR